MANAQAKYQDAQDHWAKWVTENGEEHKEDEPQEPEKPVDEMSMLLDTVGEEGEGLTTEVDVDDIQNGDDWVGLDVDDEAFQSQYRSL